MKKIYLLVLIVFIYINTIKQAGAQDRVATLIGDTCAGGTLTASIPTSSSISQIKWFIDTTLLTVRSTWGRYGVVVAGNRPGLGDGQLYQPMGIYVDKNKNIYVVDAGRQNVTRWAPGATKGVVVAGGNGKGAALNQFYTPGDIVVDKNRNIYVADNLTYSVRKWASGAKTGTIAAGGNGGGGGLNQLFGVAGICMDRFGNLFIVELWNARVTKWAPGAKAGVIVAGGNGLGSAANQLGGPRGVGVDYAGNVYVSEISNSRVTKWAPGATAGVIVAGGNGSGIAANQLSAPSELSVDSAGNIFVLDGGLRIQKWAPGAAYGITVAGGYGSTATNDTTHMDRISTSAGIFVDARENIYVSDLFQARIREFSRGILSNDQLNDATAGYYKVEITGFAGRVFKSPALHVADIPLLVPGPVTGNKTVNSNQVVKYTLTSYIQGATYTWEVLNGTVLSGQGTPSASIKFGTENTTIYLTASSACGISRRKTIPITVRPPVSPDTITHIQNKQVVVNLYPNPATNTTSIAFTASKPAKYELTLTNMLGKTLLKQKGNVIMGSNKIYLNVATLNKNMYVVNLKYDDKAIQFKLQKQ